MGPVLALASPDAVAAVVVLLFALRGGWKGFVWQVIRLGGLLAGLLLAARVGRPVGKLLSSTFSFVPASNSEVAGWLAVLVLFYLLVLYGAHQARAMVREASLAAWDRALGAVLGALFGFALVAVAFTLWASTKEPEEVKRTFGGSLAARAAARAAEAAKPLFPPGVRARWAPVLDALD